jgi:hypothetical protein
MPSEKIFTINDARKERDLLAEKISTLVDEFEYYVRGVKIEVIQVNRTETVDRRGVRSSKTKCNIVLRLREGSGFGSDL